MVKIFVTAETKFSGLIFLSLSYEGSFIVVFLRRYYAHDNVVV